MEFHFRGRQTEGEPRPPLFLFGAEDGKSCRWTGAGAQPLGSGKWARATPIVCPKESPLVRPQAHTLFCWGLPRRLRREQWGLPPYGALTLFFRWRKKSVQKKASGTATPEAARPASHCGQALRYACAWLRASWPSAISGASRPSASLGGGLRPAVALRAVLVLGSLRSPAGKKPFIAHF